MARFEPEKAKPFLVFAVVFVEQIGLSIPALPVLLAAGALSAAGKFSLMHSGTSINSEHTHAAQPVTRKQILCSADARVRLQGNAA
jgi:hypothetical protein